MTSKSESTGKSEYPGKSEAPAKSPSSGKRPTRRKAATRASHPAEQELVVLESVQTTEGVSMPIDPDVRRQLVAAEAYYLAERRGFAAGFEVEDWITAEAMVDLRLEQNRGTIP